MTVLYADTSALVRAYLTDEPDHAELRRLLLESEERVVTSEVARLEHASAITAAGRARRIPRVDPFVARFERDCGPGGAITLLPLDSVRDFPAARRIILAYGLRPLDAMHVATALGPGREAAGEDGLTFVTRDQNQEAAARGEGLEVA